MFAGEGRLEVFLLSLVSSVSSNGNGNGNSYGNGELVSQAALCSPEKEGWRWRYYDSRVSSGVS